MIFMGLLIIMGLCLEGIILLIVGILYPINGISLMIVEFQR